METLLMIAAAYSLYVFFCPSAANDDKGELIYKEDRNV
jgi:hypothetical protein